MRIGKTCLCNPFLLFSFLLFPYLLAPAFGEGVSIDDLLERESIGAVFLDEPRQSIYIERIRSAASLDAVTPYTEPYLLKGSRKRIELVTHPAASQSTPLFKQEEDAGYWFASETPQSPCGRYWAVTRLQNGVANPGVYDARERRARFFDLALDHSIHFSFIHAPFSWVSEHEFIALVRTNPEVDQGGVDILVTGARASAQAQKDAWTGSRVTASAIGSGKYASVSPALKEQELVRYNTLTNEMVTIGSGAFVYMTPSPTNSRVVAVLERVRHEPASLPQGAPSYNAAGGSIAVFDLDTGEKRSLTPSPNETLGVLSWSRNGRLLLISRKSDDPSFGPRRYEIYDVETGVIAWTLPRGAEQPYWAFGGLIYRSKSKDEGRQEWLFRAADGSSSSLSEALRADEAQPIAVSDTHIFFLADGNVWSVSVTRDTVNLTQEITEPLAVKVPISSRRNFKTWSYVADPNGNRLKPLANILFKESGAGTNRFGKFGPSGDELRFLGGLDKEFEAFKAIPHGVFFLNHHTDRGSSLSFWPFRAHLPANKPVFRYNQDLAGFEGAAGPIRISHKGSNEADLISWLYLPAGVDANEIKPYPLVVVPYAGNVYTDTPPSRETTSNSTIWYVEPIAAAMMELFAARGYAVLLPSIPLKQFGEPDEPMTKVIDPVLSAVDAVIDTGYVDAERLAVSGQSYGGYSALSIAVQSDRFKAIIAMASISNLTDHYGKFTEYLKHDAGRLSLREFTTYWMSEIGQNRMGAAPWEDSDRYIRNSPIFFADNVKTPVMLIHGDLDFINMSQAEQMFTALARLNKDVLFVRYWGEHHTVHQPQNQRDMWTRVFDFLEDNGVTPGPKTVH